jgi:GxxExxY protein
VQYRDVNVGKKRVDFIVEGVMVEIKAKSALEDVHFVQALSYLKASGYQVGLLLNFGASRIQIKRLANCIQCVPVSQALFLSASFSFSASVFQ